MSYEELGHTIHCFSSQLQTIGVSSGDHIALIAPNSLEFVIAMLAVARCGAVVVPLNTSLKEEALKKALASSKCRFAIGHLSHLKRLQQFNLIDPANCKSLDQEDEVFTKIDCVKAENFKEVDVDGKAPFIMSMTSGSTGDPKPIIFSQETKLLRSMSAKECYKLDDNIVSIAATPLYHSLAMRLAFLPLFLGGTAVIMQKFTPQLWLRNVEEFKVNFSILVSAQLRNILEQYQSNKFDLTHLKTLVSSSASISRELKAELRANFDCEVHEIYGTSELGVVTNLSPDDSDEKLGSVGKPVKGVTLQILDAENGIGEIAAKSPMLFSGYFEKETELEDGFFRTGDLGRLDAEGFLYFCGRKKDIIITGGINVYPQDIEKVLLKHENVKECAAIGLEDSHFGEAILAVVVPHQLDKFDPRELQKFCAKHLADFQQPLGFEAVSELPRNEMDKVSRIKLQQKYAHLDLSANLRKIIRPNS